ncbi:MAG: divergent polysaccharide deacetylase family protein [Rhodospirillales bacterium]|nr:divergent polysaccharide deacetylase family protein [Rhodospirillales bacterium]MDH3910484.1 divergent polysaccharide deacetylase family protein [Rhodospirillales bacterium]MDH3919440.1 divergent polysaccharide deacetylase family protein [Rhodospirillales bacterium]MDH3967018.1 divergent polysaccharide deacetylase family protein [Rhodospirillales bacterium]
MARDRVSCPRETPAPIEAARSAPMTDPKRQRDTARQARATVRAQRWAMKHRPKEPPRRRRPVLVAAVVMLSGVLAGTLVGTELRRADRLPGAVERALEAAGFAARERDTWVIALGPEAAPETAADPEAVLVPAAGPEGPVTGGFLFEEPLLPEEPIPGRSPAEIEAMLRQAGLAPLAAPRDAAPEVPLWRRNAVEILDPGGRPMIAVVIDDLGVNPVNARRAVELPGPLTLSFMTYAEGLGPLTAKARAAGHELMLHVPMEPRDPSWDPGPNVLSSGLGEGELQRRLEWGLGRFEGYVGINNHMGSRFTGSLLGMAQVMAELRARGLLFIDSMTSGASLGIGLARRMGVAHASRDIFLDNEPEDPEAIRRQLAKLERIARRRGAAIAIGHPHDATLEVLARWLPELEVRGFALVPISAIVRRKTEMTAEGETTGQAAARSSTATSPN